MEILGPFLVDLLKVMSPYLLLLVLVLIFKKHLVNLLPGVRSLSFGPVKIELFREQLSKITKKRGIKLSRSDAASPFVRAEAIKPVLQNSSVLWIDDNNPDNNAEEIDMMKSLGVQVTAVTSSTEAEEFLSRHYYDVIISDIDRAGSPTEGIDFLGRLVGTTKFHCTIFYVTHIDTTKPIPAHAFALTNRPNDLLHFLMDALERERWSTVS